MANGARWTVTMIVLFLAGIVALWPRSEPPAPDVPSASQDTAASTSQTLPEDDAELEVLRRDAGLAPCPSPAADARRPAGQLAGRTASCLGAPGTVDIGASLAGKTVLLNLWASWCVPCREEMPVLAEYARRPGSILALGVDVKEPASAGLEFMSTIGVRYPSLYDGTLQRALRVPPVLPVNYLVRPDGSVARLTDPLVFRDADQVQATVDRLLGTAGQ